MIFAILDEHPDSIDDALFHHIPGYSLGNAAFRNMPGIQHNGGGNLSYVDGHSEIHKWVDNRTKKPVNYQKFPAVGTPASGWSSSDNQDYVWISERIPYQ